MSSFRFLGNRAASASRAPVSMFLIALTLIFGACTSRSAVTQASQELPPVVNSAPVQNSYADVVVRVAPAVVTIRSARRARQSQQNPLMDDPRFRDFFGDRAPRSQPEGRERGLGSGVIVTADGYILTNHHVVDGAEDITVEFSDRRTVKAKLIGSDQPSDLAVLKVEMTNLPIVQMGNSDQVRVGDVALAIGNPLGIGQTVTSGIISAKGRSTGLSDGSYEDFLQTDAPINTGNSGGALINTNGDLIGINSQILSPSGGNIGIGFAIPTNMARSVMDQLVKSGKVRRGQLGVVVQPITSDVASSLNMSETKGVIVNTVQPGSGADKAGLRQGDVILSLNDTQINDSNVLRNKVASTAPGTQVTLIIMREAREQQIKATLGEFIPEAKAAEERVGSNNNNTEESGKLGLNVNPITPELARQLSLGSNAEGLVITSIDPNGPAADAGLQQGDVILSANQQKMRSSAELVGAMQRAGDRPLLLLINRRGQSLYVPVRPRR